MYVICSKYYHTLRLDIQVFSEKDHDQVSDYLGYHMLFEYIYRFTPFLKIFCSDITRHKLEVVWPHYYLDILIMSMYLQDKGSVATF